MGERWEADLNLSRRASSYSSIKGYITRIITFSDHGLLPIAYEGSRENRIQIGDLVQREGGMYDKNMQTVFHDPGPPTT